MQKPFSMLQLIEKYDRACSTCFSFGNNNLLIEFRLLLNLLKTCNQIWTRRQAMWLQPLLKFVQLPVRILVSQSLNISTLLNFRGIRWCFLFLSWSLLEEPIHQKFLVGQQLQKSACFWFVLSTNAENRREAICYWKSLSMTCRYDSNHKFKE